MSWWKEVVFYNIYVPSFQDSNGDGSGDLRGVLQRVDYLGDLGVNALRLSGIHACPPGDDGEGVCDYSGVHPRVGDLHDLSALREALHRRGMRLVLDFVAHHTSDEHPWFQAARASRDAPNRDDYIWADPAIDGGPPNRWESARGGPAWTLDPRSGQHYLHSFLPQQPDLNWRSRRARRAILDHARAWLEWGVDGLHVSAITRLLKDQGLRSNPLKPGVSPEVAAHDPYAAQEHIYDMMTPGVHDVVRALRWAFYETPEAVLIGDVEADAAATAGFLSDGVELLHLANNAPMRRARTFAEARAAIEAAEAALHPRAWPSLALSGGDGPRHATRMGLKDHPDALKLAAALTLLPRGTPTLYYGEELGLADAEIPPTALRDPVGIYERDHQRRLSALPPRPGYGRDGARAPMPWGPQGGFSQGRPWLPPHPPEIINVEAAWAAPQSVWRFYRSLLTLRRAAPTLRRGRMISEASPEGVWAFTRAWGGAELAVRLNLSDQPIHCAKLMGQVALGSHRRLGERLNGATLQPYEVLVLS